MHLLCRLVMHPLERMHPKCLLTSKQTSVKRMHMLFLLFRLTHALSPPPIKRMPKVCRPTHVLSWPQCKYMQTMQPPLNRS